ncbi:hypothetical protein U9M48_006630 [Paspalum notatum var. saurae]|uniref:Uncharacterized protein n=1 Tax=Paspalum notatum var. saurae TaxID=547442 RepID=A0AAQ3Q095_PASNO
MEIIANRKAGLTNKMLSSKQSDDRTPLGDLVANVRPVPSSLQVARHLTFHSSRCFHVASSDGSSSDFSYKKCLKNFIRIHYPDVGDSFCIKYFK